MGGRDAARAPRRAAREPRDRARPRDHPPRLGGGDRRRGRRPGPRGRRPRPTTCARSPASPTAAAARSWSPTPTSSPSARCSPACSPSRASPPASSRPAARSRGPTASRPARAAGASSPPARPTTPCAARPGRSSACSRSRRPTGPASGPSPRAWPRCSSPAPPAEWQEELDYKAGHWHRMLALLSMERERGEPAPPREVLDAAPLAPADAAELERRRAIAPDDVTALLLVGLIRSGVHVGASRLRSLFWARPGVAGRARARGGGDRRARRGPRAAQLGGQGRGRLLHHVLRLALLEVHRALVRAPGADPEPGDDDLDRDRRGGRGVLRLRRALEHGRGRGAHVLRVRLRLRRRPARPLLAAVLQARRLARLDLRPHEGVRRVRRPGDRREPHGRPGVDARRRRAGAADHAPRDRLLLPGLAAPGDRRGAAAADRGPVRRAAPGLAPDRGRRRGGAGGRARRRRRRRRG